jgi:high-affinity nickel permease
MASRMVTPSVVFLVQPGGVEVADERARAEEGGLVALAFFFGKRHHLDAEGQAALASAVQIAHAGQGHENAQAPVVLAAVAHRVVVRCRSSG